MNESNQMNQRLEIEREIKFNRIQRKKIDRERDM